VELMEVDVQGARRIPKASSPLNENTASLEDSRTGNKMKEKKNSRKRKSHPPKTTIVRAGRAEFE
jgi:hypothetical protein